MEWTGSQLSAINVPRRDVLVAAAAGSGKTATLTERVLQTITREDAVDINRLLIVTFTEKAAAELKIRIRSRLEELAEADPGNAAIKRQLSLLPSASVSTIHSFCGRVVREGAALLGLPPKLRTAEEQETELIMHRVMDSVIEGYYEGNKNDGCDIDDPDALFDAFEKLRPGENLYRIMKSLYDTVVSFPEYIEFYKNCAEDCFNAAKDPAAGKAFRYAADRCGAELADVLRLMKETDALYGSDDAYDAKYRPVVLASVRYIIGALEALGKGYGEAYAFFSADRGIPSLKGVTGDLPFKEEVKKLRARMNGADDTLKKLFAFDPEDASDICRRTGELCDGIYRFLSRFDRAFTGEKLAAKIMDFADMERYAHKLICGTEGFAERLAERYDEIYVDEYQDVNGLQDDIFAALSKNNRFMVGDVKQSIYSFRGSDPSIFSAYRNRFAPYKEGEPGPSVIFLSENFRCGKPIIDFTNEVFAPVFGKGDAVPYSREDALVFGKQCVQREDVPVKIRIFTGGSDEDEAEYAANEIKKLLGYGKNDAGEPLTPSDVAILCRNGKMCEKAEKALSAHGLACVNTSDKSFFDSPEVLLAVSLLSAIDNPARDVPLAASMKSPVFGFTLDELAAIRMKTPDGTLYDAVAAYAEGEDGGKCREFLKKLDRFRYRARTMQTDKFIRLFYKETSLLSLVYNKADRGDPKDRRANLLTLYELARKYEADSFKGLYGFVAYCTDMIESERSFKTAADSAGRITVQTVHSSKGLEYPVCFILGANDQFNSDHLKSTVIADRALGMGIRVTGDDGFIRKGPLYCGVSLKKTVDGIRDEACLFYVAVTRAKKYLYITASPKKEPVFDAQRSRDALYKCRSFLDFLRMSVDGSEECCRIITEDEAEDGAVSGAPAESRPDAVTAPEELVKKLTEISRFRYPFAEAARLPKKAAVSKLFPAYLDDDGEAVSLFEEYAPQPLIMPDPEATDVRSDAAARGTATHVFMQFCDLGFAEKDPRAEAERLVSENFIKKETAELIRFDEVSGFFGSELYRRMKDARDGGRLFLREYRFNVELDAADFTDDPQRKKALENESLLVQGVIDCVFEEKDGSLTVVDYKTDRVGRSEEAVSEFADRHRRQLGYYKTAIERISLKRVGRCELYSFCLGRSVAL